MSKANNLKKSVAALVVLTLLALLTANQATATEISPTVRAAARAQAREAAATGGQACLSSLLNRNLPPYPTNSNGTFAGIRGNINMIVGGRNFTAADVDVAEVPFYTVNGLGLTPLLHDGGEWPGTGGNPTNDDGRPSFGVDWAGEIYDLDRNGHYPKAVLRYIGSHCYIFVPVMFFPTLPRGISSTEEVTPAPNSNWGLYWPDTVGWGDGPYYYAPATGAKSLDPRFVLGADKNLARLKLKELADEFDGVIYPKMREYFGIEPDIDQDSKIFILLDDIRDGTGSFRGYFWAANQYPRSSISTSNEKELIYLDLFPTFALEPREGYGTIAHEFVHMIHFNEGTQVVDGQLMEEERWLEEGMTQYGQYIYNKKHTSNVDEFIKKPDTILVDPRISTWLGSSPFANYGASYLFMFYLMEKYGGANGATFMRNLVRDKSTGITSINNALRGFNTTMETVFGDWAIANFINKTRKMDQSPLNDGKWGYNVDNDYDTSNNIGVNQSLPVKFSERVILGPTGATRSAKVNSWAADYIEISGNTGNLNLGFDGDDRTQFRCAVIKRGPQVDPAVEYIYLNDKQAGNLIVQAYGAASTYDNLVLVPMVTASANYEQMNYVYSATFDDLKVALFPNPIFENFLHIILRTTDAFVAEPRLQMTYDGKQGYLVMTPVNKSTYITNYPINTSGEGLIEAWGTTTNGTILSNKLAFTAVYYPARSEGQLRASFATLDIPAGAVAKAGPIILARPDGQTSVPGIDRVSPTIDVGLPVAKTDRPLRLHLESTVPILGPIKGLGLYRHGDAGLEYLGPATVDGAKISGEITVSGGIFAAHDTIAPLIESGKVELVGLGCEVPVTDGGSGIDPATIRASWTHGELPTTYDSGRKKLFINTRTLPTGDTDVVVKLADRAGNEAHATIRAQAAGGVGLAQVVAWPNPARAFSVVRAAWNGLGTKPARVEVKIFDTAGDEVTWMPLTDRGGGVFEARWDLRARGGREVANGTYFARVTAWADGNEITERRKIAVLR
jgi:hypothetical protein